MGAQPISQGIFRDRNVLSPHYVPDELPFREKEMAEITRTISPANAGQKTRNLFVYGKTGTGKTCSVRRVMGQLEANGGTAVMTYINCRIYNSRYRVMQKILKQFMPELEKSGFGLPFLYEKMIEIMNRGVQLVIVLDEVDMVKDLDELVYTLTRSNDEAKKGGVSIVGISNKLSFKNDLDARSKSSLYESEMIFAPYTAPQLQQILRKRALLGMAQGAADESAINLAAAIAAQETGDARYALKLFEKAAEVAETEGKGRITDLEVEAARKKVDIDLAAETVNTLPENHQLVLYAIAKLTLNGSKYSKLELENETGFLISGEVYEEYERTAKQAGRRARSSRWYKEYLTDLETLGLITLTLSGRGLRGHTTLIKLGYDAKDMMGLVGKRLNLGAANG
ncbi:ORC1-type DNA replication protein [uncultured archaeon]|nr:ORC1-type DNA replication protein [uncultured archaeon]